MRISRWFMGAAAIVVAAAAPAWAQSIDTQSEKVPLFITQTGSDINAALFGFFPANGRVVADAANPDRGMVSTAC